MTNDAEKIKGILNEYYDDMSSYIAGEFKHKNINDIETFFVEKIQSLLEEERKQDFSVEEVHTLLNWANTLREDYYSMKPDELKLWAKLIKLTQGKEGEDE